MYALSHTVLADGEGLSPPAAAPDVAIIIPTYNESANIEPLLARLHATLNGHRWEAIFVDDDSPDGTAARVQQLGAGDPRIRFIRRLSRRGLSSAVIEGMLISEAPLLAVIDADLQHDEAMLPALIGAVAERQCDLAVGSRYVRGGSVAGWHSGRAFMSRLGTLLARTVLRDGLRDPMSGFFAVRREVLLAALPLLSRTGSKIMLDILLSAPARPRVREFPYTFRPRIHGSSKLDGSTALAFGRLLADKARRRWLRLPKRKDRTIAWK